MSQLGYTPGSGAQIKTDQGTSGAHMQVVKLAQSGAGNETLVQADAAGLLVNVSQVQGNVAVTAPATAPVSVRLSNGSSSVDVIPVSVANVSVPISGSVTIIGNPVVTGTVTANQGTPNPLISAWPVQLTDGTNTPHLTKVGQNYALDVNVAVQNNGVQQDKTGFVEGGGLVQVVGAVLNDAPNSPPSQNQAAALRINSARGLHCNLRDSTGAELGTPANPLTVLNTPPATTAFWRRHYTYAASQTAVSLHSAGGGLTTYVLGFIITPTTAGGTVTIYDQTDSNTTEIYAAQPPVSSVVVNYPVAFPLQAAGNTLFVSTGTSVAGDITVWGYDR